VYVPPNYDPAIPLWKQDRPCVYCAAIITPQFSQEARKHFCNPACSARWRITQPEGQANLSKAGSQTQSRIIHGGQPNPAALWRQPRPCESCGLIIHPRISQEARVRFCSMSCASAWGMSQPERKAKVHNPEVARKRGEKKSAWFAAGSPRAIAEKARIAALRPSTEAIRKMQATMRARGIRPKWIGGNGRGITTPQRILWEALRSPWMCEYPVPVTPRRAGLPTCFYLDLAHPEKRIAIEVDGGSHRMLIWKDRDARKEQHLRSIGWTVARFWNEDILKWKLSGMPMDGTISATLSRLGILLSPSADLVAGGTVTGNLRGQVNGGLPIIQDDCDITEWTPKRDAETEDVSAFGPADN